ncbi:methyltransferase domain-containing protein [Streptomyces sp. NPDC058486]|uniref:methyltransferase domain-containing protein n=1 Tax=unclassified Streptomyces TaxID=2593676 RepID=UPI0036518393
MSITPLGAADAGARSGSGSDRGLDRSPARLLAVLDAVDTAPGAAALRQRSYTLLGLGPGVRLLDVGCGAGRAVGEAVALGAAAMGLDRDEAMIAAARARLPGGAFAVGDATALPYGACAFDAYRADKVLHDLPDPTVALAEAHRVLAPGGRIVLTGQDWDTFVIDADDAALIRALVHARADLVPSPRAARAFRNLLLDGGFHDVTVEVTTTTFTDARWLPLLTGLADAALRAGAVDPARAAAWTADQRRRAATGRLFAAVPFFTAAATRR